MTYVQASFDGLALGSLYALIVIGFVVIYRATGIINFAQGGAMLLGAYLTYNATATWGLSYWTGVGFAIVVASVFLVLLQRSMLQRIFRETLGVCAALMGWAVLAYNGMGHWPAIAIGVVVGLAVGLIVREIESRLGPRGPSELPIYGAIMITLGVLIVIKQIVPTIWGFVELPMIDPWEIGTSQIAGITLSHAKLATLTMAWLALIAFFLVDRHTKIGLAMRAVHSDHEAAIAHGISTKMVFAAAFAIAGATAALAGAAASSGSALLTPNLDAVVFLAFPAMILGGLDSPVGAIVGGLLMGWAQNMIATVLASPPEWLSFPELFESLGTGFERVGIYILMIAVLVVRPYGLFGTKEVRRV